MKSGDPVLYIRSGRVVAPSQLIGTIYHSSCRWRLRRSRCGAPCQETKVGTSSEARGGCRGGHRPHGRRSQGAVPRGTNRRVEAEATRPFQNNPRESYESGNEKQVERLVETFIEAVQSCTPAMRRRLVAVLKGIDTLESCYPVAPPQSDQDKP